MLNKQKGNMYGFVTHTWNPIKGRCPHDCSYCYMKRFPQGDLRLDEKCFKDDLGKGNFIFVGSSTDMWAKVIPTKWITKVLNYCKKYPENTYLFQTKNPSRLFIFRYDFPPGTILGTTIETDRRDILPKKLCAPLDRARILRLLRAWVDKIMISIEPIMVFDLIHFVKILKIASPDFISIGADSKGSQLLEPNSVLIKELIERLKGFTEVRIKPNLERLLK